MLMRKIENWTAPLGIMHTTRTLQEVVFAIHFSRPADFNVVELADWYTTFREDFPHLQQLPPLDEVTLAPVMRPQIYFGVMPVQPRLLLISQDQRETVQLQSDRFAFGWRRLDPPG